jgi:outer membrane immunogenic protein
LPSPHQDQDFDDPDVGSFSTTRAGWTVGVGAEHAFTPNWIARAEYRYTDFGSITDSTINTDSGFNEHNDITACRARRSRLQILGP